MNILTHVIDPPRASTPRPVDPPASVPEAQLRHGMHHVLTRRPDKDGVWVFAYGSLIWDAHFDYDAAPLGTVKGLARHYSVWDDRNRGTPERRALTLALDPAPAACSTGIAFHLPGRAVHEALWSIWNQEMIGGFYTAEWIDVTLSNRTVKAITFVADPVHPLFAGALPEEEVADIIAAGQGPGGTAAAYLRNTAAALRARNAPDRLLERLEAAVEARNLTG